MSRPTLTPVIERQMLDKLRRDPKGCVAMPAAAYNAQGQVLVHRDNMPGIRAQRHLYRALIGPLERNQFMKGPTCGTKGCLNPHHYLIQNHTSRRKACPKGHEYTPENTILDGRDRCLTCRTEKLERRRKGGTNPAEVNASKTKCIHGHELTEDNVYVRTHPRTGATSRQCRTCTIERALDRYYDQKESA